MVEAEPLIPHVESVADSSLQSFIMCLSIGDLDGAFMSLVNVCRAFNIAIDRYAAVYRYAKRLLESGLLGKALTSNLARVEMLGLELWDDIPTREGLAVLTTYQLLCYAWKGVTKAALKVADRIGFMFPEDLMYDVTLLTFGLTSKSREESDVSLLSAIIVYTLISREFNEELFDSYFKALAFNTISSSLAKGSYLALPLYRKYVKKTMKLLGELASKVKGESRVWGIRYVFAEKIAFHKLKPHPVFLEVGREAWGSGKPISAGKVSLRLYRRKLDYYRGLPLTHLIVAPRGSGKTVTITSMVTYLIDKGYVVFNFSIDPREQFLLNQLPLSEKHPMYYSLLRFRIRPRGLPLTSISLGAPVVNIVSDIVLESFELDRLTDIFNKVVKEPKLVVFRYNDGFIENYGYIIEQFIEWRRRRKSVKAAVVIDEAQEVAASRFAKVNILKSVSKLIRHARGLGLPLIYSTQRPYAIDPYFRAEATHIYFGAFKDENDRKAVLSLLPNDPESKLIKMLITHHKISLNPNYRWFIQYDSIYGQYRVLKTIPPPCMVENPRFDVYEVLREHGLVVKKVEAKFRSLW